MSISIFGMIYALLYLSVTGLVGFGRNRSVYGVLI
jgi:hypothetical protein